MHVEDVRYSRFRQVEPLRVSRTKQDVLRVTVVYLKKYKRSALRATCRLENIV